MNEKYILEKAQAEGQQLQEKIESGEASDYSEAEKQIENSRDYLLNAELFLKSILESMPQRVPMGMLKDVAVFIEKSDKKALAPLAQLIYLKAIPKAGAIMAEKAVERLDDTADGFWRFNSIFGDDVFKAFMRTDLPEHWAGARKFFDYSRSYTENYDAVENNAKEISDKIRASYAEFLELVKDSEEYNLNLEETLTQIKHQIEENLKK